MKKVQKHTLTATLGLALAFTLIGCDDSKATTKPTNDNLVGIWEYADEINLSSEESKNVASSMEFFSDGTAISNVRQNGRDIGIKSKWLLRDGNRLQEDVTVNGTEVTQITDIELTGKGTLFTYYLDGINSGKENPRKLMYRKKGSEITNTTFTFTDARDGKKYKAVNMGLSTWMAENLNFETDGSKCYGEGGKVILWQDTVIVDTITLSDNEVQNNCKKYGRLYNWETAKKICPDGWHLPNNEEVGRLYRYAGGIKDTKNSYSDYESEKAGKYLKAKTGWNDYEGKSGNGEDKFGFTAFPGGSGYLGGSFGTAGLYSYWWSISKNNFWGMDYNAEHAYIEYEDEDIQWNGNLKPVLFSVRCVKD